MARSLFDRLAPEERTSRRFRDVRDQRAFTAARRLMNEIFAVFPDVDRSFVQEFQTGGFSPRVLELALFAHLKEQGYALDRIKPAPDFIISGDTPGHGTRRPAYHFHCPCLARSRLGHDAPAAIWLRFWCECSAGCG